MRWSIRIARVAGIDVKIHLTFLLLLAWIGWSYYRKGGTEAAVEGILFILLLFGCVLLHEFGHALAGRAFGIRTPDITLLPIGGVARMQRMPDQPWQEMIVAIAGPLVNVIIAGILFAVLGADFDWSGLEKIEDPQVSMMAKLAIINVMLVVFNMIPAFPMDGGRVLRSGLAMITSHAQATRIAAGIGQGLAFVFGFIGLLFNPLLIFIALFVYLGASQEAAAAHFKEFTGGARVADAIVTHFVSLRDTDTLEDAVEILLRTSQHEFPVIDAEGHPRGILIQDALIDALRKHDPGAPVAQFARQDLPHVHPGDNFDEAFRIMQEASSPALPVVDRHDRLVGLITVENVGEMIMVSSILPRGSAPAWRLKGES